MDRESPFMNVWSLWALNCVHIALLQIGTEQTSDADWMARYNRLIRIQSWLLDRLYGRFPTSGR